MTQRLTILLVLVFLNAAGWAQDEPGSDGQLDDQFEVNNYYAEQSRQISRNNAEQLTLIDKAYGEAVKALSAENVRRTQAIFEKSTTAHKTLAEEGTKGSERDAESKRIGTESQESRAELLKWYDSEMRAIRADHAAKRAAQMAATEALYEQLGERRAATLQRLLNGPVGLTSLQPLSLPATDATDSADSESGVEAESDELETLTRADDEQATITTDEEASGLGGDAGSPGSGDGDVLTRVNDAPMTGDTVAEVDDAIGPGTGGGGIDLGGTVDLETPGDEILANANPDQHRMREQLFRDEQERRRRAEEEAASRLNFIQTTQAQAHTTASASSLRPEPDCDGRADADGDGVRDARCGGADCDDSNPNRYPGNTEVGDPDHVDEDCDPDTYGNVDEDGDGFISAMVCNSDGINLNCGNDCDDSNASVYPGATEVCNYINDDCDRFADEDVLATKYLDRDGDLHGDPGEPLQVCAQTNQSPYAGHGGDWLSAIGNDCDDTDPTIWQGCSQ